MNELKTGNIERCIYLHDEQYPLGTLLVSDARCELADLKLLASQSKHHQDRACEIADDRDALKKRIVRLEKQHGDDCITVNKMQTERTKLQQQLRDAKDTERIVALDRYRNRWKRYAKMLDAWHRSRYASHMEYRDKKIADLESQLRDAEARGYLTAISYLYFIPCVDGCQCYAKMPKTYAEARAAQEQEKK